jgi:predicted TIM-barrel fold metal-dependent hydrolase
VTRRSATTAEARIFDADLHTYPASAETLRAYLSVDEVARYNAFDFRGGTGYVFPRSGQRLDAIPPTGAPVAGSSPQFVIDDHLDRHGIAYGLLTPATATMFARVPDADVAAAVARATNDWTIEEWLPADARFLGSIVVATADPAQAAEEIARLARHPRMVQVYTAAPPCLLGDRFMYPIYEACDRFQLPLTVHVGGGDIGVSLGHKGLIGYATSYCEAHIAMCIPAIGHVISAVMEGIFEKFPRLKVVIAECGTAWLPFVMWRMDMEFLQGREDVPWLTKPPSEYLKQSIRFTTQPLEEPPRPADLVTLLELIEGRRMLIYSSDYPHFDADDPKIIAQRLPADWRPDIFFGNARELYRLDERFGRDA